MASLEKKKIKKQIEIGHNYFFVNGDVSAVVEQVRLVLLIYLCVCIFVSIFENGMN